jgi:intracellular septation protein A
MGNPAAPAPPEGTAEGATERAGAQPDWEPGVPSLRDLAPSIVFGAVIPLAVYYLVRHHVHTDADALIIAGIFPCLWVIVQFIRQHKIDPVGAVVLFGFAVGVLTSTLMGGNAYVLKARDSVFTALFGLACLGSLLAGARPLIFYVGRFLSAGNDPAKVEAVWGVGLLIDACTRLSLAAIISTGPFLAISPVITGVCLGAMFLFTVYYSNRARQRGAAMLAEGQSYPSVPLS